MKSHKKKLLLLHDSIITTAEQSRGNIYLFFGERRTERIVSGVCTLYNIKVYQQKRKERKCVGSCAVRV